MKRRQMNKQMRQNPPYSNGPQYRPHVPQWGCVPLPNFQMQMRNEFFQGPSPFLNRPPMNFPVRPMHRPVRPMKMQNQGKGGRPWSGKSKRLVPHDEDESGSGGKKRKTEEPAPPQPQQYVVPCSKGTEKITVAIWEYFLNNKMNDDDLNKKLMLQQTLHTIIKEGLPESRLFIVGSSMNGFATRSSDMDMCLLLSDNEINQKKQAPIILRGILKSIRHCSFVSDAQVIPAKCPILKFTDTISGFECDMNINNTVGIRNTHLLRYYSHMDWRVRPLMLFIKRWARFHDINDASKKTISSYSLCLMLLHYLQAGIKPPVLPCLQSMKPKLFSKVNHVCKLSLDLEPIEFTSENKSTLGELFLGFLDYYANQFSYVDDIISVRKGKKITHNDVSYRDSDWKHLCIEEPFECTNTARSVFDQYVFMRILRVIDTSFHNLMKYRDVNHILDYPF